MKHIIQDRHEFAVESTLLFAEAMSILIGVGVVTNIAFQYGIEKLSNPKFLFDYYQHYIDSFSLLIALLLIGAVAAYIWSFIIKQETQVQTITLAKLSIIWLPKGPNTFDEVVEKKEIKKLDLSAPEFVPKLALLGEFSFHKKETYIFMDKCVMQHLNSISNDELKIILTLLELLENEGGIASVTGYQNDPENRHLQEIKIKNKSSYDIARRFTLYDHSIRVSDVFYDYLIKQSEDFMHFLLYIPKGLILGLSHDIGKIKCMQPYNPKLKNDSLPHAFESEKMFFEMFHWYDKCKEIKELIAHHHIPRNDLNSIGKELVAMDKDARYKEAIIWMNNENRVDTYFINLDGSIQENKINEEFDDIQESFEKFNKVASLDLFGGLKKHIPKEVEYVDFDFVNIEFKLKELINQSLNTFIKNSFIPSCFSAKNKIIINIVTLKKSIQDLLYLEDEQVDGYLKHALYELNSRMYAPIKRRDRENPYLVRYQYGSKHNVLQKKDVYGIEIDGEYLNFGYEELEFHRKKSEIKNMIFNRID